jgi:hypothetical protein
MPSGPTLWGRHEKVQPRILDRGLHHGLLVGSPHIAEVVTEQVMALHLLEAPCELPSVGPQNLGGHHPAVTDCKRNRILKTCQLEDKESSMEPQFPLDIQYLVPVK